MKYDAKQPTPSYGLVSVTLSTCKRSHGHKQPMETQEREPVHTQKRADGVSEEVEGRTKKKTNKLIKLIKKKKKKRFSHALIG